MTNSGCSFFYSGIYVFWFNQVGETALTWAAASGKCDAVTELISLGADVDIQDNVSFCLIMTLANCLGPSKCTV